MSEIDDLREELNALWSQVTSLQNHISDVDESMSNHVGLDWGASGQNYPHPNQSVSVAEFGGGKMRLDNGGIQIIPTNYPIIWTSAFQTNPASPTLPAVLQDATLTATVSQLITRAWLDVSTASALLLLNTNTQAQAQLQVTWGGTSNQFAILQSAADAYVSVPNGFQLNLSTGTADPTATLYNASLWYRSDLNKIRARINAVTENVATESYVTANAGGTVKTEQMVTPYSWCSLGVQLAAFAAAVPGTAVWPAANDAIFVPFTLDESTTFTKAFWYNGGVVSGNVDIGIYNEAGTKQVSMGTTAQATVNVLQEVNIADTTLAAGRYYMALACDNITAQFFRTATSTERDKAMGLARQGTAFPLPATATLATPTAAMVPFFGFSIRTLVV